LIGMTIDAAWSLNLAILISLITSVFAHFFVAMGMAWHSFGLALTGRFLSGLCIGCVLVVADTIAAQFNRRRRAVTFGVIVAVQALCISLNSSSWITNFTRDSLDGEYEKMNDIFLIVALMSLGVGFLWAPMVSSFDMEDSPKRRFWKWHMPKSMWALALAQIAYCLSHAGSSTTRASLSWELGSMVIVAPVLGLYMDITGLSQGGSLAGINALILAVCLGVFGAALDQPWLIGLSMGPVLMLLRCVVPQVASRDCLSTSFGIMEGALVLGWILYSNIQLTSFGEISCAVLSLTLFILILISIKHKWEQLRLPELTQPLYGRGG
jgi:MFS family permease